MIQWVEQRLQAWGAWVQSNRGLGSKGLSAQWGAPGGGGRAGSFVPVQSLEASRTHDWVQAQQRADRDLLAEVYCTPRTSREHAAKLKMSLRTLYRRLHDLQTEYAHSRPERLELQRRRAMRTTGATPDE